MLSSLYKYAKVSFIGGGFRGALHNTFKAVVWDVPVVYGSHSNNKKFLKLNYLKKIILDFQLKVGMSLNLLKIEYLKIGILVREEMNLLSYNQEQAIK